ncbi:hypothetical protein [Klebsiella variicola]|nr:hypothetical protein [Klebsiella variicola]
MKKVLLCVLVMVSFSGLAKVEEKMRENAGAGVSGGAVRGGNR